MTLTISEAEYSLLCQEYSQSQPFNLTSNPERASSILDKFETIWLKPTSLGQRGCTRRVELMPGIKLDILNWRCENPSGTLRDRDLILKVPAHDPEIQLFILTSGCLTYNKVYPTMEVKRSYLSGSGISPAYQVKFPRSQHFTGINLHIDPEVVSLFLPDLDSAFAEVFLRKDEWKESFFPEVTPLIRTLVRQIINAPYRGVTKKLYLQAKVFELLAMQLDPIMAEFSLLPVRSSLKPQTIDCIYQARDILTTRLENPPSIVELARQIGISDRTLRSGFQELFGTTVIGYLTQQRLEKAELLLREKQLSVAEVANLVGYSHLGYFAKVFKRQFGITPSECLVGKLGK